MIAEDNERILNILKIWLGKRGHEVFAAENGLQAKKTLQTQDVDLLITDINMPYMTGTELVEWWCGENQSDKPVMMLSANCDQNTTGRQMKKYNVTFCKKPFSPQKLIEKIEQVLSSAGSGTSKGINQ